MRVLVGHLYRQVMRRGRIIGLSALVATLGVILWASSIDGGDSSDPEFYHTTIIAGGTIFTLALLIVTVAVLRDERDGGTLPFIFLRPIPRSRFALGAIFTGILVSWTIALIAWGFSSLGAMIGGVSIGDTIPGLLLFGVASIGYAAVLVPLGYLAPRALLIGLMYVVIIEGVLAQTLPSIAHLSIWRISISIYAGVVDNLPGWLHNTYISPLTPGVGGGLVKLAGILLAGWGVLYWALKERDAV